MERDFIVLFPEGETEAQRGTHLPRVTQSEEGWEPHQASDTHDNLQPPTLTHLGDQAGSREQDPKKVK